MAIVGASLGAVARVSVSLSNDPVTTWINNTVAAGGSVASSTQTAMNAYVNGCISDGTWTKLSQGVILPFASDGFAGVFTPLVIPSGKTITNVNFVSGDYSLSTGIDPGASNSSKRLSSNITGSDIFTSTSVGFTNFQRIIRSGINPCFHCGDGTAGRRVAVLSNFSGVDYFDCFDATSGQGRITATHTPGNLSCHRTAANATAIYRNGSVVASGTGSGGTFPSTDTCNFFAFFNGTSFLSFDTSSSGFLYAGPGLTAAEESLHNSRVLALMAALGRVSFTAQYLISLGVL